MSAPENTMDPALIQRLESLFASGILNNSGLQRIIDSLEKKGGKRKRREEKKATKIVDINRITCRVSYAQSLAVWGEGLVCPEKSLQTLSLDGSSTVWNDPRYGFIRVVLQGLSLSQMATAFPEHNWRNHARDTKPYPPGYYLISLNNPLLGLENPQKSSLWPSECVSLDLPSTVETILTLRQLGRPLPDLFFLTTGTTAGHSKFLCVGFKEDRLTFITEETARSQGKIGYSLVKYESWM